jgi:hypothetical protein
MSAEQARDALAPRVEDLVTRVDVGQQELLEQTHRPAPGGDPVDVDADPVGQAFTQEAGAVVGVALDAGSGVLDGGDDRWNRTPRRLVGGAEMLLNYPENEARAMVQALVGIGQAVLATAPEPPDEMVRSLRAEAERMRVALEDIARWGCSNFTTGDCWQRPERTVNDPKGSKFSVCSRCVARRGLGR